MENLELNVNGAAYSVEPQENGTYRILQGEQKIGVIYPEPGESGTDWKTLDDLDAGLVDGLGAAITDYNA